MKKASRTTIALLVVLSVAAWAVDVSGTWEMSSPDSSGEMMTRDITITQDGNKIMVTMPGFGAGEGKIEDNTIEWTIERQTYGGKISTTYTGTVDGNTMKGTFVTRDSEVEWTAKKK